VPKPKDLHEWVSFDDPTEDRTWIFDVSFLTSRWSCIFGRGCKGVLTEDFSEAVQGCCSYGAHLTGPDDVTHVQAMAERLSPSQWQFRTEGLANGIVRTSDDGETTTTLHDDACIFLNRPGFDGDGLGCAFHHLAEANGQRHVDVMPEVCWMLPLRRVDETDDQGHVTSTIREWKRRDWGEGGHDFHWWCTEEAEAFGGQQMVYEELSGELRVLVGDEVYDLVAKHLAKRRKQAGDEVFLPHPAVRRR
jgi:hypothetical protein